MLEMEVLIKISTSSFYISGHKMPSIFITGKYRYENIVDFHLQLPKSRLVLEAFSS